MRRFYLWLALALLAATPALGQSTTVSGTITDAGSQTWNNGTYTFTFVPNPQYPTLPQYVWTGGALSTTITGTLSGSATYSVSLPSNTAITPGQSQWKLTVCPQATSPCFVAGNVPITGATQTVNATPPAILINLAVASPPVSAYGTGEVTGAVIGSQFYLLGTGLQVCAAVSGNACTSWTSQGSGTVASVSGTTNQIDSTGGTTPVISLDPQIILSGATGGAQGTGTLNAQNLFINGNAVAITSQVNGLNSVLGYAYGTTINDGSAHIISSAPAGSPFHGLTTLAGLAALTVNGTTPFSWITSNPVITNASGAYQFVDSNVPNLDIAWLAIQTALLTGKTYIPAGKYIIGSVIKLPLYIPLGYYPQGTLTGLIGTIVGDGWDQTIIQAGSDFGNLSGTLGYPLIACGDPSGTSSNSLGRYTNNTGACYGTMQDMAFLGPQASPVFTMGTTPVSMDGIAWGSQLFTQRIHSNGFLHDWTLVGDHTSFSEDWAVGGSHGFYWPAQNASHTGDLTFNGLLAATQSIGSLTASSSSSISGTFTGQTYLQAPYGIFCEAGSSTDCVLIAKFDFLKEEFVGNAFMHDEDVFASNTYTDTNKTRNASQMVVGAFYGNYSNNQFWGGAGNNRGRRASFDMNNIGITIEQLIMNGAQFSPAAASAAPHGVSVLSTFNCNGGADENAIATKIKGGVDAWISQSGTTPIWTGPSGSASPINANMPVLEQTGVWGGYITVWATAGTYGNTNAGDIMQWAGSSGVKPGGANGLHVAGIVKQTGIAPGSSPVNGIPIASWGQKVNAATYWQTFTFGPYKLGTGVGGLVTITAAGTSGTPGSFGPISTTGGGCGTEPTFDFTVSAGGVISAASWVTYGSGCTSAPTMPTTASSGLSGATLTAQWPPAMAVPGALTDANNLGDGMNFSSPGGGANLVVLTLQIY